jgi:signal transduction histidine kinase
VERTRISRDIHDQLGQMLTAMNMDVRWLEKKLDQPVNPKMRSEIKARLTEVAALSDQCIETVQRIATELRPSVLDNLGLAEAIRDEARRYSIRTGISCLTDLPDHLVTSSNQGDTAFFRIFQELLTNVARHSKAKSVNVSLNDKDGWRVMVVSDDGVGMSAGVLNSRKSVGITGMKERASALAGSVEFFVGDGCGTRVEVKIPNGDCIESQSIRKGENRLL